jgi:hypothetical protein
MQASTNSTVCRRKVVPGRTYRYNPVRFYIWDARTGLEPGEIVTVVVNLPGCPPANTMGHCHVYRLNGTFAGLVLCNSLEPEGGAR